MMGPATLRRVLAAATIVALAAAVLTVWIVSRSQADEIPLGIRIDQAVVGDDGELVGVCFAIGLAEVAEPDKDELTRQVREKGSNARLASGSEAAPDAGALAERTKGELIAVDHGDAYVLYVEDGARRVDTFSRYESSEGDVVWIRSGTKKRIPCGDD